MKQLIKFLTPHGIVLKIQEREREKFRARFLKSVGTSSTPPLGSFSWAGAIDYLEGRGCLRQEVINGSMPEASLELISSTLRSEFGERQIIGVHVGNFVGVSLAHITDAVRSLHSGSFIVGIDPNLPHRGIENPQKHVAELIQQYGLTKHVALLASYSLEKSQSNDGMAYDPGYDPKDHFHEECACENGLRFVERFLARQVDFLVIDGNHDDAYLARELAVANKILKSGGILILDDVCEGWAGVKKRFHDLKSSFTILAADGRIGIAKSIPSTK